MLGIAVAALASLCLAGPGGAAPSKPDDSEVCAGSGEGAYRVVELQSERAALVLFGSRHRTDPTDPIIRELEGRVAAFSPTLILVEGPTETVEKDRDTAVAHGGEAGLLCYVAEQRGIPCRSADLTEAEEARRLLQRHSADEVLLFMVVRPLAYFNPRPASQRPPGDLVAWALRRYGPLVGLPDATEVDLARTCKRVLHRPWDPPSVTTEWHNPEKGDLLTQRMSRESNALREPYQLEQMLGAAQDGARVLVSMGEGHVCNLRAELKRRWNQQEAAVRRSAPPVPPRK